LQGGTQMVLRADTSKVPQGEDVNAAVDGVTNVIERRINAYGVAEPIVQKRGTDRIIVELPGIKNVEEAKNLIGKTAQLDFREQKTVDGKQEWVVDTPTGSDGEPKAITGQYFNKAEVGFENPGNQPQILFEFDSEGGKLFGEITGRLKGKQLGIFLDDQPLSTPTVQSQITDKGRITGT